MKFIATLACFVFFNATAQTSIEQKIKEVENGLTKAEFVTKGEAFIKGDVYDRMKERRVNGVSVAVVNNGKIEWMKGYGIKDADNTADSVSPGTLFQLASIGKIITTLAALHLVKEEKISLDEDVNNKLKSWKVPDNQFTSEKKVTLRTLLSHSAGLTDDYGFEGYYPSATIPSLQQVLNAEKPANNKKKLVPAAVPGSKERYSGGGFIIIQQLIEDITGMPFRQYVERVVFQPISMTNTTYDHQPDINLKKDIARGHQANGKTDKKRKYNVYPEMAAAGPWTTAEDAAKLLIEIQKESNGQSELVLNTALTKEMLTPQINNTGLGMHLLGSDKCLSFWHSGNNAGYVALLYGITEGKGAVVLTNSDGGEWFCLEMIRSIANAYNWPVMQTKTIAPLTESEKVKYAGNYKSANNTEAKIEIAGNDLRLKMGGGNGFALLQLTDGLFTIQEAKDRLRISFERDASGNIISLIALQDITKKLAFTKY